MSIPAQALRSVHIPMRTTSAALLIPALYVVNFFTFSGWYQLGHVPGKPWLLLVWIYGLAILVPLVWRDRAPVTVFLAQCVLTVAAWPMMGQFVPVVGVPVALNAVAVHRDKKVSLPALVVAFVPTVVASSVSLRTYGSVGAFIGNCVFLSLVAAAAWVTGRWARADREHVERLERERARLHRERETTREAVTAERRRIARELHDIVSHAVTVIVLQAAGAARIAESDPAKVRTSLGHIQDMGRQAMAELRRLLGVLQVNRSADPAVGLDELGPQSGLADLGVLLDSLRGAGMLVAPRVEGLSRDLDPSVDLAAYRIVQEGLTNVLKHAGKDADPRLGLVWKPHSLQIQISNDLPPGASASELSTGHGLLGLRERAHAAGGHLRAGRTPDGAGYRLTATLPIRDAAPGPGTGNALAAGRLVAGIEKGESA